jgi:hypothetical protein
MECSGVLLLLKRLAEMFQEEDGINADESNDSL